MGAWGSTGICRLNATVLVFAASRSGVAGGGSAFFLHAASASPNAIVTARKRWVMRHRYCYLRPVAGKNTDESDPFVRLESTHRRIEQRIAELLEGVEALSNPARP